MKLAHLRYFKHLASVMSYTKAAKDLFIAQPTLSAAIIRLGRRSRDASSHLPATGPGRTIGCLFDVAPRRDCPFQPN